MFKSMSRIQKFCMDIACANDFCVTGHMENPSFVSTVCTNIVTMGDSHLIPKQDNLPVNLNQLVL